jgi:hypothetical protein
MPSQISWRTPYAPGAAWRFNATKVEGTAMSAESSNGVHHARPSRLPSPSPNGANGAHHLDAPPSTNRDNGTHHAGAPPSTNGDNGAGHAAAETPSTNGDNGRDVRGRFAKGNTGGPGNPFARQMARLRRAFCKMVTEEDIQAVARQLLEQAKAGDVAAARLALSYTIGKPAEAVNPDTLDLDEWEIFRRSPVALDDLRGIVEGIPVDVVGPLVRTVKPYLNAGAAAQVKAMLLPEPKPSRRARRAALRRQRQSARAGGDRTILNGSGSSEPEA